MSQLYVVILAVIVVALLAVAIYRTSRVKTKADYLVAGRTLPAFVLVLTLLTSWIGAGSLFAGAENAYRNGFAALWQPAGGWLGLLLIYFIAPRARKAVTAAAEHVVRHVENRPRHPLLVHRHGEDQPTLAPDRIEPEQLPVLIGHLQALKATLGRPKPQLTAWRQTPQHVSRLSVDEFTAHDARDHDDGIPADRRGRHSPHINSPYS